VKSLSGEISLFQIWSGAAIKHELFPERVCALDSFTFFRRSTTFRHYCNYQREVVFSRMSKNLPKMLCLFCGCLVEPLKTEEEGSCIFCGERERVAASCSSSHHCCDRCKSDETRSVISAMARTTTLTDPAAIAELMMGLPQLGMLDCDHAVIAAGAFMAALKNSPYGGKLTDKEVSEALDRTANQVVKESCSQTGVCGIIPAIGACFSLFLGVRFGADKEQQIAMDAATKVSQTLTDLTGPVCCKAYVRASLGMAATLFAERFGIMLPASPSASVCRWSDKHPYGCREEKCPYYQKLLYPDIFADSIHLKPTVCHS
jgi:hypothetical protein